MITVGECMSTDISPVRPDTTLTEAAQQTVESLSQSTNAIGDLDQVSSGLRNGVLRFKLDNSHLAAATG